jgi:4-hydroxybenzoate polyprenyltransferase
VTARLRLALVVARPALVFLLALSGLVGLALGGVDDDPLAVGRMLVLVAAFVVYAVSCNDLADLEIDRVNLPHDARRPLVSCTAATRDVQVLAAGAAVVTASAAATEGLAALGLTLAGLAVATAYSLPPFRLSRRGVVAPLVLPALFVGLPFVLGVLAGRPLRVGDLALLAALYVGFIGRIVLKDFRDVVGDRMFGKRTFLVRHGRRVTCVVSATCWVTGTALLVVTTPATTGWYVAVQAALACTTVVLITRLAVTTSHRQEERLVSAVAIIGRAAVAAVFVQVGAATTWAAAVGVAVIGLMSLVLAIEMLRHGPRAAAFFDVRPELVGATNS